MIREFRGRWVCIGERTTFRGFKGGYSESAEAFDDRGRFVEGCRLPEADKEFTQERIW